MLFVSSLNNGRKHCSIIIKYLPSIFLTFNIPYSMKVFFKNNTILDHEKSLEVELSLTLLVFTKQPVYLKIRPSISDSALYINS